MGLINHSTGRSAIKPRTAGEFKRGAPLKMRLLSLCCVGILLEMLMYCRVHSAEQEARMSRAQGCAGATAFSQNSALPKAKIHYF